MALIPTIDGHGTDRSNEVGTLSAALWNTKPLHVSFHKPQLAGRLTR